MGGGSARVGCSGKVALRRASGARSAGQASAQAKRAAERAAECAAERAAERSVAERAVRSCYCSCALRVVAWHGIVQLIVAREGGGCRMRGAAGVQLYFPREDDDDMFICQTSPPSFSRSPHMGSHCHA